METGNCAPEARQVYINLQTKNSLLPYKVSVTEKCYPTGVHIKALSGKAV